jgi:hypothetical protein
MYQPAKDLSFKSKKQPKTQRTKCAKTQLPWDNLARYVEEAVRKGNREIYAVQQ